MPGEELAGTRCDQNTFLPCNKMIFLFFLLVRHTGGLLSKSMQGLRPERALVFRCIRARAADICAPTNQGVHRSLMSGTGRKKAY